MKKASEGVQGSDSEALRDLVLAAAKRLELDLSSIELVGGNKVTARARSLTQSDSEGILIEAVDYHRKVGVKLIGSLNASMSDAGLNRGILISTTGFSKNAEDAAGDAGIDLLTSGELLGEEVVREDQSPLQSPHNLLDVVFKKRMSVQESRPIFEAKKRKMAFGILGSREKLDFIEERYAPVASFSLERLAGGSESRLVERRIQGRNTFWVNIHNCQLFYLYFGVLNDRREVRSTNVLRRMMDLPEPSVRLFSQIFEAEKLDMKKLDQFQLAHVQREISSFLLLERYGLASLNDKGTGYVSNVSLPQFDDKRYDMSRFSPQIKGFETISQVDTIEYPLNGILLLLCDFFHCRGAFTGVTYMPYLSARYIEKSGKVRHEHLINMAFEDG